MGRPVTALRAHLRLVLAVPVLLCARGLLAQATTASPPLEQPSKQVELSTQTARERLHPVVDEVTYIGATKAIDIGAPCKASVRP